MMLQKLMKRGNRYERKFTLKIYEQFSSKIKQSVEYGHKQIFLTVPSFLLGYPVFDRNAAAKYIARQFVLGGFTVKRVSDYDIYVSWFVPKKKKEKREHEEDEGDFPNLMNLKKMANQYRRSA